MLEELTSCRLCPRACGVNRLAGERGYCGAGLRPKIARAALHHWEEPFLSGSRGSGTVFFSHCNLHCVYCQNYEISQQHRGREVEIEELAEIFLDLAAQGAHNLNLVTPTPYLAQIRTALSLAKAKGLAIPIVYNTNGYERPEALATLDGLVDIYLPDLKYASTRLGQRYSDVPDYFPRATRAILAMAAQVGEAVFNAEGILQRGLVLRHLLLPGCLDDSRRVLDWLAAHLPKTTYVSLMAQYFPTYRAEEFPELNRRVTAAEYDALVDHFLALGLENGLVQELDAASAAYVPEFEGKV